MLEDFQGDYVFVEEQDRSYYVIQLDEDDHVDGTKWVMVRYVPVSKWKSTKVAMSSPETMQFIESTGDGLMWKVPAYKISVDLKFDGKDYAVTGPTVPANVTIAVTSSGARSFEMVEKANGKVVYRGTYTLSEDGKTLTAVYSPEGTNEKVTAVYDRQ